MMNLKQWNKLTREALEGGKECFLLVTYKDKKPKLTLTDWQDANKIREYFRSGESSMLSVKIYKEVD